jgi:hypothetical protein
MLRRDGITIAAMTASLWATPSAAQTVAPQSSGIVETINREGFARFAAAGTAGSDVSESPVLTWYVHRFLTLTAPDPEARAVVDALRKAGMSVGGRRRTPESPRSISCTFGLAARDTARPAR